MDGSPNTIFDMQKQLDNHLKVIKDLDHALRLQHEVNQLMSNVLEKAAVNFQMMDARLRDLETQISNVL